MPKPDEHKKAPAQKPRSKKPKAASWRLFIAAFPPIELAAQWHAHTQSVAQHEDLPSLRVTPLDQFHITLQFLGDRPKKALPDIIESADRAWADREPFQVRATSLAPFPTLSRAKVLAIELEESPELDDVKRRLVSRLAKSPRPDKEQVDRFRPHCTAARFQRPPKFEAAPELPPFPGACGAAFELSTIAVVRSTLTPDGAVHERIAVVPFESYDEEE